MSAHAIGFVLPQGSEAVSGGNLYNRRLLEALSPLCELRTIDAGEWENQAQFADLTIVDTLNLKEFSRVVQKRISGQKFVLLVHHLASLEPDMPAENPSRALEREVLGAFDAYIVTSAFTASVLRELGLSQPILIAEPPLRLGSFRDRDFVWPARALMASNLIPRKGVLEFLRSFASSVGPNCELSFDIVGRTDMEPAYSAACAEAVAKIASERCKLRLLGTVPHRDMRTLFERATLYVSASRMETFGISLQDARHFGLPIFAVRGGNTASHLIFGQTGELFDSPSDLGHGLGMLLKDKVRLQAYFYNAQENRTPDTESWTQLAHRLRTTLLKWF